MENLISVTEAAERLGVTRQYILQLIRKGRIEGARKIGNQWGILEGAKIRPTELQASRFSEIPRAAGKKAKR